MLFLTLSLDPFLSEQTKTMANPTVDPVRFALWTLRDKAAHRQ